MKTIIVFCIMNSMKPNHNFINTRRINIANYLNTFFPSDISKLVSKYDYYLEGKSCTLLKHSNTITCLAALPDGRIVSGSTDGIIRLWDLQNGLHHVMYKNDDSERINCIIIMYDGFSHNNNLLDTSCRIFTGSSGGKLRIWNPYTRTCEFTFKEQMYGINKVIVLSDNRIIIEIFHGGLKIFDPTTGLCDDIFNVLSYIKLECLLPDGRIVISEMDNTLTIFDIKTRLRDIIFKDSKNGIGNIIYFDNKLIVEKINYERQRSKIKIWNLQTKTYEATFLIDTWSITVPTLKHHIRVLSDGCIVSNTTTNNDIKVWNVSSGKCDITLTGHSDQIYDILTLSDGRIVSCSKDKTIKIWS
jgi:WD40 repeat protein